MAVRTKVVYRNKEDALTIWGMHGALVVVLGLIAGFVAQAFGILAGAFSGALLFLAAYSTFANRPPFWLTYGVLYFVRRRTVLSPAAEGVNDVQELLDAQRALYEAH